MKQTEFDPRLFELAPSEKRDKHCRALADLQNEAEVFRFGIPRLLMLRPLANPLNDTTNPMKTIEVTISPTGEVKIDAIGFKGTACDKACAEIERALGKVTQRTNKPEYQQQQQQKIGQ